MNHLEWIQAQCTEKALETVLESALVLVLALAVVLVLALAVAVASASALALAHNSPTTPHHRQNTNHLRENCRDCNSRPHNPFPHNAKIADTHAHSHSSGDQLSGPFPALGPVEQLVPLESHHQAKAKENC